MPVEILARYTSNTYMARAKGYKQTATNTISARDAAVALARKLGLDPAEMREGDSNGDQRLHLFHFPGEDLGNNQPKS
jgi:hypothetical protein